MNEINKVGRMLDTMINLEYYQWPFREMMRELEEEGFSFEPDHPKRRSYWDLVPPGSYSAEGSRGFIEGYAATVESALREILCKRSVACWLHLIRRSFIMPLEEKNDSPRTRSLFQRTLTAAVQKFARLDLCSTVGWTNEVPLERILRGRFARQMESVDVEIELGKQLVLTDFDTDELREYIELCKLVYEYWLASAFLRANGKGASLLVDPTSQRYIFQEASEELAAALRSYDSRSQAFVSDCLGFVVSAEPRSHFPLPFFNAERRGLSELEIVGKLPVDWSIEDILLDDFQPNFSWSRGIDLSSLYSAGKRFGAEFEHSKGYSMRVCFGVMAALLIRTVVDWRDPRRFIQHWQRAYRGPIQLDSLVALVQSALGMAGDELGEEMELDPVEILAFLRTVTLDGDDRANIDLASGKGTALLVPCGTDAYYIDYFCIPEFFFYLFRDIEISDQSFKGALLEGHLAASELPRKPCKGNDGSERQFDASLDVDGILVLVECKAFGWHPGVEVGDPRILRNRAKNLGRALEQVDSGAQWLVERGAGRNFDVGRFTHVAPIVVTPFVEFVPSGPEFWFEEGAPRVLTPDELREWVGSDGFRETVVRSPRTLTLGQR